MMSKKRMLKQQDPRTTVMVITLERHLCNETLTVIDRMASGHFLALVFLRSRFDDAQHIESISLDVCDNEGFVDCETSKTKTSNTKRNATGS